MPPPILHGPRGTDWRLYPWTVWRLTLIRWLVTVVLSFSLIEAEDARTLPVAGDLYVSRYKIELDKPPSHVPTDWNADGPLLGNGNLGVVIGGAPENQQYWISKCDFWRAKPLYPWFTPALVGYVDLRIPALRGASYHTEQLLDKAEVTQTFATADTTVKIKSWTPATQNSLVVEISCTGKPVSVDVAPGTRAGYGATVQTGQENDVAWLTRSFVGKEMDWPNQVTMAVRSPGARAESVAAPKPPPMSKAATMQIGHVSQSDGTHGFAGMISDVRVYNQVMTDEQVAKFTARNLPTLKESYHLTMDRMESAASHTSLEDGPIGKALSFTGDESSYFETGSLDLPLHPATISAWIYVNKFDDNGTDEIIRWGTAQDGLALELVKGMLSMRAEGNTVTTEENVPLKQWLHVVGTSDGNTVQLYMDGLSIASYVVNGGVEHLDLSPAHPILLVTTVGTNHETKDFQERAIDDAKEWNAFLIEDLRAKHEAWWRRFWQESRVQIGDVVLERYYYGSFYIMACCSRNTAFPPALFGNQASGDRPWMGGDYHLNYNYQAPWWGCYVANHIALTDPYDTPILQFLDRGKKMARDYLGKKGVLFSVGIGPLGSSSDWTKAHDKWVDDSEDKHFFAGQKSNAAFCTTNMIMRWRLTYDLAYARKVYPFLLEVANFWEDYLVLEDGRYVDYHDSIQEGSGDDMNNLLSLGLVRGVFETVVDMSTQLGVDANRRGKWQDILAKLSDYSFQKVRDIKSSDVNPDFLKDPANLDKTVFRYTEKGFPWSPDCTLGIQHIYPAGALGLDSSPDRLEAARNTVSALGRWDDSNHTMTFYPAAARVGYDPEVLLTHLREQCESPDHGFPNLILNYGGGGIETCSTVTATINEMLLQSHQNVLRLFADWPKNRDASFDQLRAYGAFLVSAAQRNGVVGDVTIVSEKGRDCTVVNPWPGLKVNLTRGDHSTEGLSGERFTFKTGVGEKVTLAPAAL